MNSLFAYGTLMCEDIFYSVTGARPPSTIGVLREYSRHPVAGRAYPGILPRKGFLVHGIVYLDLPEGLWPYLDRFEGGLYERRTVRVECPGHKIMTACTYVVRPQFIPCLKRQHHWDFSTFLATGKKIFAQSCPGFNAGDRAL